MNKDLDKEMSGDDDLLPSSFGSWRKLYAIVLSTLGLLILVFYFLTKYYS